MFRNKTFKYISISLGFVIAFSTFLLVLNAQQKTSQQNEKQTMPILRKGRMPKKNEFIPPPTLQEIKEADAPVADFNYQVESGERGKIRRFRNEKFRQRDFRGNSIDISKSALNENSFVSGEQSAWTDKTPQSPFPITPDTIVVIGVVKKSEAYITEDKANIYSEFTFDIQDVLKPGLNGYLPAGNITLYRMGGRVKLPSGKNLYRGFEGLFYPKFNKTYLMFLKYDAQADFYSIKTGYELRNGIVVPLDGRGSNGQYIRQYKEHGKIEGAPVNALLKAVRNEIFARRSN